MKKGTKYSLPAVAAIALAGYFVMTITDHASTPTTAQHETNQPNNSQVPVENTHAGPENNANASLLPDVNPSSIKKAKAETSQEEVPANASGHFITVQNTSLFQSIVVDSLRIDKDKMTNILNSVASKTFSQGKGHFYTIHTRQNRFYGKVPEMAPLAKDDYDRYMAIVADSSRYRQGYVFHFAFDKWHKTIDYDEFTKLLNEARPIQKNIKLILVRGHTDSIGTDEYNLQLSAKRAKTIAQEFHDIPLILEAVGESEPIADNRFLHGRQLNRRAEIFFILHNPEENDI